MKYINNNIWVIIIFLCSYTTLGQVFTKTQWIKYSYHFISFKAPKGTQILSFPDPLPEKKPTSAFFDIKIPFNDKVKLLIHIECLKKESKIMSGLSPIQFYNKIKSELLKDQKTIHKSKIQITKSKLSGELIVINCQNQLKQLWQILAYNDKIFLSVLWTSPTQQSEIIKFLVISILNTFEFNANL
jgi:hypothetical protein